MTERETPEEWGHSWHFGLELSQNQIDAIKAKQDLQMRPMQPKISPQVLERDSDMPCVQGGDNVHRKHAWRPESEGVAGSDRDNGGDTDKGRG